VFVVDYNKHIDKDFFLNDTAEVAKNLIGKAIVRKLSDGGLIAGLIVETEAYLPENDFSCHAVNGPTLRNAPMFEDGGILYVYKIYGIHHCINIVTETKSRGCAVLLRSLEPLTGTEIMQKNRNCNNVKKLCKGPGNLTKAFDFSLINNYDSVICPDLFIQNIKSVKPDEIGITQRIGIKKSQELPLRFYLKKTEYISGKIF
jgi:DNA-3-methyladenine glycosylase